ncbi:SRPBCC family protein [Paludisphaera soli]|uniref:SRPBCC family protein n=1 Tax=Paludisphaera soli TaxID=2712865 RepID=UPI0013EC8B54|nr:SRPBCC family protein [Paludisphaera soli]
MSAPIEPAVALKLVRRFAAPAERVFDAWLDPATVGRWLFATPTGAMVRVEVDARVGGSYAIVERREGEDVEHVGEYLEIDRPRRLAFTLKVPKYSQQEDRLIVEIVPLETGCELTLTHERLAPAYHEQARAGWGMILDGLATRLG